MSQIHANQLIRKQFLVTPSNVAKLEKIAEQRGTSAADVVRMAIDAFDADGFDGMAPDELMDLVSTQLKEAITSTRQANEKVSDTLNKLS